MKKGFSLVVAFFLFSLLSSVVFSTSTFAWDNTITNCEGSDLMSDVDMANLINHSGFNADGSYLVYRTNTSIGSAYSNADILIESPSGITVYGAGTVKTFSDTNESYTTTQLGMPSNQNYLFTTNNWDSSVSSPNSAINGRLFFSSHDPNSQYFNTPTLFSWASFPSNMPSDLNSLSGGVGIKCFQPYYHNIDTDDSYTGDAFAPPVETIKPNFTYSVENKTITAHDYNLTLPTVTPDEGYTINGYSVEWTLSKCATYEGFPTFTCTGATISEYQLLGQDTDFSFTVPDYGDYTLSAQYLVQECYRYPSYPSTPDYCFFVDLGAELGEAYDFTSTTEHLPINGQTTSGDTTGEDCSVSGFCVPPGVVCTLDDGFFKKLQCEMGKSMNTGLINPSINALKKVLTSLTVPTTPTCSIVINDVTISAGKDFPLSDYSDIACDKADELNDAFPISAIVINFFLAIIELLLIVRIFNRLTDHTKNDIIEGL